MKNFLTFILLLICGTAFSQSTYTQTYTSGSGLWICPNGVTSITVECWGSGGGGGGANSAGSGGGGGGGYSKSVISVTPGNVYYYSVGAAGTAGTAGSSGTDGGSGNPSWLNASSSSPYSSSNSAPTSTSTGILASGGSGGTKGTNGAGGAGASTNYGTSITKIGGAGATGSNTTNNGGGGGGGGAGAGGNGGSAGTPYSVSAGSAGAALSGSSGGGAGGAGGAKTSGGSNAGVGGTSPGGGGGGCYYYSVSNVAGGTGGSGQIIITYTACIPLFEQDFAASTTKSDYVGTSTTNTNGMFDEITSVNSSTTPVAPTINTTTSNKLRFTGTDATTKSNFVRSTDFISTPTGAVVKFDITFSSVTTGANQSAIFYLGSGFATGTAGVAPTSSATHSRLQFATSSSSSTGFAIRNLAASNIGPSGAGTYFTGKQTVTWVVNNSGGSLSYLAPDGTTETVADDTEDIWVGTTKAVNDDGAWGPTKSLTDIAFYYLNGTMIIDIDNIIVNSLQSAPTSSAGTSSGCTGFTANWTNPNCSAFLDVSTSSAFASTVSGYSALSVSGTSYAVSGLSPGTTYYYRLRSGMGSSNTIYTAYSSTQTVSTSAIVTPSVSISSSDADNSFCSGTSVTFTAAPTNGGSSPSYQWKLNNANSGTNSTTYTSSSLANGDTIKCVMTSDNACAVPTTGTSSNIINAVITNVTPSVSITSSDADNSFCSGTSVTFTAAATNGGSSPSYQWQKNGTNISGATSSTYATSGLSNNDIIRVVMTANNACQTASSASSSGISNAVISNVTPSVSVSASSNSICAVSSATFTATPTNGGSSPSYQWKLNGGNIGTSSSTYSSSSLSNGDAVTVTMTANNACQTSSSANGNSISMTVSATSVGGTPASEQHVLSGATPSAITLSGKTGSVVKWQWSTDTAFSSYTDISNATTTLSGSDMGTLTQTTYYRAVVQSGACASANSSRVAVYVDSPMPIELLYFTATRETNRILLEWETGSETNNDFFTVERTNDGKTYKEILRRPGIGNSSISLYYREYDENPHYGESYYRLKQTDYDGRFTYSSPVYVYAAMEGKYLSVYPNPVLNNTVEVAISSDNPGTSDVFIYDQKGTLVHKQKLNVLRGLNQYTISIESDLPRGIYYMDIGGKIARLKF